jgi:hypothetical protein
MNTGEVFGLLVMVAIFICAAWMFAEWVNKRHIEPRAKQVVKTPHGKLVRFVLKDGSRYLCDDKNYYDYVSVLDEVDLYGVDDDGYC